MKIYKNPWVTRESYFVKTGAVKSAKMEAPKSAGYAIDFWDGKWNVRKAMYYNQSLAEMPVIAENRASIQAVIDKAILDAVLGCVSSFNAVDFTQVVRCKDCEFYRRTEEIHPGFGTCDFVEMIRQDNDFCSKGERRDAHE
jgi:hypothetical protein